MKILKHIWNYFFVSKKKHTYHNGAVITEIKNQDLIFSLNQKTDKNSVIDSVVLNEDKLIKEPISDVKINSVSMTENNPKNKRKKNVVGLKTKQAIKKYFELNGSLDTFTCQQKFKVKSLKNFIWHLRKDGLVFKTERIFIEIESGKKVAVINYKLIAEK